MLEYNGHPQFIHEAQKVASKWVFPPLTYQGQSVKAWVTQRVFFKLKE